MAQKFDYPPDSCLNIRNHLYKCVSWAVIDFGAVYDKWAENEYGPLFGGGSLFGDIFTHSAENLNIFQKIASKFGFCESARKCL